MFEELESLDLGFNETYYNPPDKYITLPVHSCFVCQDTKVIKMVEADELTVCTACRVYED
jgi:hypothetical protein